MRIKDAPSSAVCMAGRGVFQPFDEVRSKEAPGMPKFSQEKTEGFGEGKSSARERQDKAHLLMRVF